MTADETYNPMLEKCYFCSKYFEEGDYICGWFEHYVCEECTPEAYRFFSRPFKK